MRPPSAALGFTMRGLLRAASTLALSIGQEVRHRGLARFRTGPSRLTVLLDDECESHEGDELTTRRLASILTDPLFGTIAHVSLVANGPALRPDLPEFGQIVVASLVNLASLELVTRGAHSPVAATIAKQLARAVDGRRTTFRVRVAVDAVDQHVGGDWQSHAGFASAAAMIKLMKSTGLPVTLDCSLNNLNSHHADDVVLWCRRNGIDEAFRLVPDAYPQREATPTQDADIETRARFHLTMFLDRLSRDPVVGAVRRMHYRSLVEQLAFGAPPLVMPDARRRAVVVDSHGTIAYSSPRRPTPERQTASTPHDVPCITQCEIAAADSPASPEDFPAFVPVRETLHRAIETVRRRHERRRLQSARSIVRVRTALPAQRDRPSDWRHVLITGWYGTETTGDKAILGELLAFLEAHSAGCEITLTTLDRKVSRQTAVELPGLRNARFVALREADSPALIDTVDAVIIGGGPLMEIPDMAYVLRIFAEANRQRKARVIFGCGIGPLRTARLQQITEAILQLTTAGFLRDRESFDWASRLAPTTRLAWACDPALAYLRQWLGRQPPAPAETRRSPRIAGLLRANTSEFVDLKKTDLTDVNTRAAQRIAQILEFVCKTTAANAVLLAMNAPWIGGDDRLLNREVAAFFNDPNLVKVERRYLPLEAMLQSLHSTDVGVAMRYHGHLFCIALGIPFLSIDYTGRAGKVRSLVERIGYTELSEDWPEIDARRGADRLQRLVDERAEKSIQLRRRSDEMVIGLYETYDEVFGVPPARSGASGLSAGRVQA